MTNKIRNILFSILKVLGWIISTVILFYSFAGLQLHLNFFTWTPEFDLETMLEISTCLISLLGMWFLSRHTNNITVQIISFLICSILIPIAICLLFPEKLDNNMFLGRHRISPLWYRLSCCCLFMMPIIIWSLSFLNYLKIQKASNNAVSCNPAPQDT